MKNIYLILIVFGLLMSYAIFKEDTLLISFLFLISQSALGILWLNKINKGMFFQDFRVFFICTYSLYAVFLPLTSLAGLISIFKDEMSSITFLYGSGLLGFNVINMLYPTKWENKIKEIRLPRGTDTILAFLFLLIAYSVYYMHSAGISVFSLSNMSSRTELGKAISQSWIVITFIIIVTTNYLIYLYPALSRMQKMAFLALVVTYCFFQISLGNRREISTILFFLFAYYLTQKKTNLKLKYIFVLLVLFIGSFYVTIIRDENVRSLTSSEAFEVVLVSNEFIYPIQTTGYIIKDDWDFRFGSTYFLLPVQVLIPRAIYPGKPATLGAEFVEKTFGSDYMGFAYTPISEAFLNFGYFGPFLVMFVLGSFFILILKKRKDGLDFKYFILYCFVFDFCRGDFSSVFYALFVSYIVGYHAIRYISRKKFKII